MAEPQATHRYHLIEHPTKAWQAFVEAVRDHATRTAGERAARDRQRKDVDAYREEHRQ